MKNVTIENERIISYLEDLSYEVDAHKDLLSFMIRTNIKPDNDSFRAYHEEYVRFFSQYETAKKEFAQQYVIPVAGDKVNWSLDFSTHEVTIESVPG